jgi:hypothetical protein
VVGSGNQGSNENATASKLSVSAQKLRPHT